MKHEEEEGYRYELARGVLKVVQVPNDPHGQVVDNLHNSVTVYRHQHPRMIRRIGRQGGFQPLGARERFRPKPRSGDRLPGGPKGRPRAARLAWVAEVVSKRGEENDYVKKRKDTFIFGIREYWIIDPQRGQVTVLIREEAPPVRSGQSASFHRR